MGVLILQSILSSNTPLYLRHRSPGRLRVAGEHFAQERTQLTELLKSHRAVNDVQQNPLTSSLLVCYEQEAEDEVFRHLMDLLPQRKPIEVAEADYPRLLPYVGQFMKRLNQTVHKTTFGWLDAQVFIPTFLCLYGVRRLLIGQPRLPTWVTVFWWSYATLWNLSRMEDTP